jgi:hypothetical protein
MDNDGNRATVIHGNLAHDWFWHLADIQTCLPDVRF